MNVEDRVRSQTMASATAANDRSADALRIVQDLPIPLERDVFLRTLIRELAGTLQDVVGLEEASVSCEQSWTS